jgi:hypothetical protein
MDMISGAGAARELLAQPAEESWRLAHGFR